MNWLNYPQKILARSIEKRWFYIMLLFILLVRIAYGLTEKFWDTDEIQCYLIGLKAYSLDEFPAWGPDNMYKIKSRLAGGLMGTLIYLPLKIFAVPEAPIIFLNIISFAALIFLALYFTKRFPGLPHWFVWIYVLTAPWTFHFSTYIINPSYILVGSICLFIGFLDRVMDGGFILKRHWSYFLVGFALAWIFQVHMSWPLFGPIGLWLLMKDFNGIKQLLKDATAFMLGLALSGLTLIPTILFSMNEPMGGTENNIVFNLKNVGMLPHLLGRMLAMPTMEIARFSSHSELLFAQLESQPWLYPIAIALLLFSLIQVGILLFALIKGKTWVNTQVRNSFWIMYGILAFSFLFSIKPPISYTFYLLFPFLLFVSFSIYQGIWERFRLGTYFSWAILLGLVFHIAHVFYGYGFKSLYENRSDVQLAIDYKEHTLMHTRRVAFFEEPDKGLFCENNPVSGNATWRCSYEYPSDRIHPQSISSNEASDGEKALVLTHRQPFGIGCFWPSDTSVERTLKVRFKYKSLCSDKLLLVADGEKDAFWKALEIELEPTSEWKVIDREFVLNNAADASFNLYPWKQSTTTNLIYLDELEIVELND